MKKATVRRVIAQRSRFKLRGYLEYELRDATTGDVLQRGRKRNVVTAKGRGWALEKLTGSANANTFNSIAIGTTNTAPASNDTALGAYTTIIAIGSQTLSTATNAACSYTGAASFNSNQTFTGSSQIGEFGIYNANSSTGTLFNHVTTGTFINFGSTNTLSISIVITN